MNENKKSLKFLISTDSLEARKNKETTKAKLLSVVLADIKKQEIDKRVELNEIDVLNIVKKIYKSVQETLSFKVTEESLLEKTILENYLDKYTPKALSEKEIEDIIATLEFGTMKEYMSYFKENYNGQYDGGKLSSFVKNKLSLTNGL